MRPITVSVGPLGAANAITIVPANQVSPGPGQFLLSIAQPPATSSGVSLQSGSSITNGVLHVTSLTGPGVISAGMTLCGNGLPPNTTIIGPAPGNIGNGAGSTWIVNPPVTFGPTFMRANWVITLDAPRQLAITTAQAAPGTLTIYGLDAAGSPMQETLAYNGGNLVTSQNFAAVTQVVTSVAATLGVGTAPTATTPWVRFDPFAAGSISKQCVVNGVATYTVQVTNDDPGSPTNPVPPGSMTWSNDTDLNFVGASTSLFGSWGYAPIWARVLLQAGAGSVTATFVQQSSN